MKRFLKIATSLMLALAVVLVPMAVTAAVGDPVTTPSFEFFIVSGDTVTVPAGKTVYFEIGAEGMIGTFGFIVEGAGNFDVAVCTEGTTESYAAGVPIAAVNGKVETTITSFESTYGAACFSITNKTSADADYFCKILFPEGSQGNPKAVTLTVGGTATVTVPAGAQYYVAAVLPQINTEYMMTITGAKGFSYSAGWGMPTPDTNGTFTGIVSASEWTGGAANFSLINNTRTTRTYTLSLANMPFGSQSNPDTLPIDETVTKELEGEYWYTWTATADGTLKLTMDNGLCADGWTYNFQNQNTGTVLNFSTGWGESDKNVAEFEVSEGDIVFLGVSVPNGDDAFTFVEGTLVFTTELVCDSSDDEPTNPPANPDQPDQPDQPDEPGAFIPDGETFTQSTTPLVVGDVQYALDPTYPYTVFTFHPTEVGKYTISSTDSLMGIVGYFWVDVEPTADVVCEDSFVWECTAVGQGIYIAVSGNTNFANISIIKGELVVKEEIPWVFYENSAELNAFTFEGDIDSMEYVDTYDDINDVAVLGDDGYYHLNAADGPILYVDLDDAELMDLVTATSYGQLKYVVSENGEAVIKIDYNSAFGAYLEVADKDEGLYPLTVDLIEIYQKVGESQSWYGADGWVGGELDDAWMFACCYEPSDDDSEDNGATGGDSDSDVSDKYPATGDDEETDDDTDVDVDTEDDSNSDADIDGDDTDIDSDADADTDTDTDADDSNNADADSDANDSEGSGFGSTDKLSPDTGDSLFAYLMAAILASYIVLKVAVKKVAE